MVHRLTLEFLVATPLMQYIAAVAHCDDEPRIFAERFTELLSPNNLFYSLAPGFQGREGFRSTTCSESGQLLGLTVHFCIACELK